MLSTPTRGYKEGPEGKNSPYRTWSRHEPEPTGLHDQAQLRDQQRGPHPGNMGTRWGMLSNRNTRVGIKGKKNVKVQSATPVPARTDERNSQTEQGS